MEPMEANVQTQPGKRLAEEPKRKKGGKGWKAAIGIIAAAAVVFYGACCILAHTSDTYFPHTQINGVDVSGKTQSDAASAIQSALRGRTIDLTLESESEPFTTVFMSDLLAEQPVDPSGIAAVYDQQHSGLFSGGWQYLRHLVSGGSEVLSYQWNEAGLDGWVSDIQQQVYRAPQDTSAEIDNGQLVISVAEDGRQVSADTVRSLLLSVTDASSADSYGFTLQPEVLPSKTLTAQEIHDQLHGEMKNASYDAATGAIIPEQVGADFDLDAVQSAMDAAAPGETLTLPATIEEPEVTASQLKAVLFRDVLGEARTHVSGSAGRIGNVKLSAKSINGIVLNSGDTFSYNQTVGQRTEARGYKPAPAYVKGETVDEVGGGICQTSSTLYLACLMSNLEITERYAHRYIPAYISPGMDATVSWGGPDYKFTNDTLYPIKIVTSYSGGYLTVKILGTNVNGTHVKMTNKKLSTVNYEVVYEDDNTLAPGTEKVKTTPYTGSKWKTYRSVYDANGNLISSNFEASSDYKSRNKVILRGPAVQPGSTPADTPASNPSTTPAESETPTTEPSTPPAESETPTTIVVPPESEGAE